MTTWEKTKEYIDLIDEWDCNAFDVARGLKMLVAWIEENNPKIEEE